VLYGSAPMRVVEVALLVAILFHALNGLRLLLIDLVDLRPRRSEQLLRLCVLLTVVLGAAGGFVILSPLVTGIPA
jgi:succinate dehydrogenase / fumarate reductase cytochrome b subunit